MEPSPNNNNNNHHQADRQVEQVQVDDLKRDLSSEFSPSPDAQVFTDVTQVTVIMFTKQQK